MRRATDVLRHGIPATLISIHALHEESDLDLRFPRHLVAISIHALHEESDLARHIVGLHYGISIHALHEESDKAAAAFATLAVSLFQSTLSMRRATHR